MSTPQHDDAILRVARSIFDWRLPREDWSNPLFQDYRDDCLALAVQYREMFLRDHKPEIVHLWTVPSEAGIDARWRQAFVATKLTEVLAELAAGVPLAKLDVKDRAWVKAQAEQTVEDVVKYFDDPVDDGGPYEPHREYDPSECDFDGRTSAEVESGR